MTSLVTLLFAAALQGQVDQDAVALQLLRGDRAERLRALAQAQSLRPQDTGAELRAALIAVLDRNNRIVVEAAGRKEPLVDFEDPDFIAHVAQVVSQLGDPRAIPALARALGTGSTLVRDALAGFGEQAAPDVLRMVTAPGSRYEAVGDGLMALRFMVEGAGTPPLSAGTREKVRRAAMLRLTGVQYFPVLWYAIDLAVALDDSALRRIVQAVASDRKEVIARGTTAPDLIVLTQKRAAARLSGERPEPHYRSPAERARVLNPGGRSNAAETVLAGAQGQYCRPLDDTANVILHAVQRQTTAPADSAYRTKIWKVPLLTPSDVALVSDERVCQQAATAYDREMAPETSTLTRGVYVVRLGSWYLVVDSEARAGEWMRGIVLDSAFQRHAGPMGL